MEISDTIKKDIAEQFELIKTGELVANKPKHQEGEITETIVDVIIKKYGMGHLKERGYDKLGFQILNEAQKNYDSFCHLVQEELRRLNKAEPQVSVLNNKMSKETVDCSDFIYELTTKCLDLYWKNDLGCFEFNTIQGVQSGKIDHTSLVEEFNRLRYWVMEIDPDTYFDIID